MTSESGPLGNEAREWIDECLQDLVSMASDRGRAEQKANRIRLLMRALHAEVRESPKPGRFMKYSQAKDAILDVLDERGRAMTKDEIVSEVIAGGFKLGKNDVDEDIKKSLGAYKPGSRGTRRKTLRYVGDLIGRGEWPEERFK